MPVFLWGNIDFAVNSILIKAMLNNSIELSIEKSHWSMIREYSAVNIALIHINSGIKK